ncbi:hypothetical protein [Hyphomicrobium sp.]|uniref:hypothetical protein n=1 Tax=Hyphomicrobium sp. TaxID=82 RepID=UPI003F727C2C
MGWRPTCLTALLLVLSYAGAEAIQPVKSLYTALDISQCEPVPGDRSGAARLCAGLPGYPVYVAEGRRGTYLSVGPDANKRQAARQTLRAFNTLFDKRGQRSTIEWRFVVRDAQPVPYATIVRYFTESPAGAGEVLVVTRVTDRETCHVAYVDALANLDAIVLARKLADTIARQETCPLEPAVQGAAGRSPM